MTTKTKKQQGKKAIGMVSFIAIVAILFMLLQAGINFGDLAGFAIKLKKSCTDSDSGPDLTVLGTTTGPEAKTSTALITEDDYCKDSEMIVEYVCENGLVKEQNYGAAAADRDYRITCECEEGACTNMYKIQKTSTKITDVEFKQPVQRKQKQTYQLGACYDSDGGHDWYTKGTVSITGSGRDSSTDYCCIEGEYCPTYTDTGRLREFYCKSEAEIAVEYPECPSGYSCSDGACV